MEIDSGGRVNRTPLQKTGDKLQMKALVLYYCLDIIMTLSLIHIQMCIRDRCLSTYKIDCAYYFALSAFAFNAMLSYTKIELELLTDNDMHQFLEQSMRSGISQYTKNHSVANNQYIEETFDTSRPVKFLKILLTVTIMTPILTDLNHGLTTWIILNKHFINIYLKFKNKY